MLFGATICFFSKSKWNKFLECQELFCCCKQIAKKKTFWVQVWQIQLSVQWVRILKIWWTAINAELLLFLKKKGGMDSDTKLSPIWDKWWGTGRKYVYSILGSVMSCLLSVNAEYIFSHLAVIRKLHCPLKIKFNLLFLNFRDKHSQVFYNDCLNSWVLSHWPSTAVFGVHAMIWGYISHTWENLADAHIVCKCKMSGFCIF